LSWTFLLLREKASLSSYRPVIVHACFLATDRALWALVRLSRIRRTTQRRIGTSPFSCLFVLRVLGRRVLSSYPTWDGPLVGKGKRSKLATILLLPGLYHFFCILSLRCFCCMYSPCRPGSPVPSNLDIRYLHSKFAFANTVKAAFICLSVASSTNHRHHLDPDQTCRSCHRIPCNATDYNPPPTTGRCSSPTPLSISHLLALPCLALISLSPILSCHHVKNERRHLHPTSPSPVSGLRYSYPIAYMYLYCKSSCRYPTLL